MILRDGLLFFLILIPLIMPAGPPYDTDDPVPVDFRHWEAYYSSIGSANSLSATGTAPHVEINYGILPDVQLHVIAPMTFYTNKEGQRAYGYGDTEFGVKCRLVNMDSSRFQIGTFPLIEVPTGNAGNDLGNGKAQVYLPLWIQKTIGKWTTYGGGGYWINPGRGNKNYVFLGWQAQYQVTKAVNIGAELYDITADKDGGKNDLRFRVGAVINLTDNHHLLFSIGRSIVGDTNVLWYLGYQLTI